MWRKTKVIFTSCLPFCFWWSIHTFCLVEKQSRLYFFSAILFLLEDTTCLVEKQSRLYFLSGILFLLEDTTCLVEKNKSRLYFLSAILFLVEYTTCLVEKQKSRLYFTSAIFFFPFLKNKMSYFEYTSLYVRYFVR